MFGSWCPEFVYIPVFMGIHETINNNQEYLKHYICFKFHPFNYKNIAHKSIQLNRLLVSESFEVGWVKVALILHWR